MGRAVDFGWYRSTLGRRSARRPMAYDPTIMVLLSTGNTRRLAGAALVVLLLALVTPLDAAETDVVCKVSADPSKFDHQQLTLKGIVSWLHKSSSRGRPHRDDVLFDKSPRVRRRGCLYSRACNLDAR
jgi:hypothetical protein